VTKKSIRVWVKVDDYKTPFSRGILARSIMRTGMTDLDAYDLAESIKEELIRSKKTEISPEEIFDITHSKLKGIDDKLAGKYRLWREISMQKTPYIILIGGASGIGTTTVATELGHRLGIGRVIGTDSIREVMRKVLSKDLMPSLHVSSCEAWRYLKAPLPSEFNRKIFGYQKQVERVTVGIEAIIERSMEEGLPVVIEGIHLLPGYLDKKITSKPNVFFYVLTINDEREHRLRFIARAREAHRLADKYLKNFEAIRAIQENIVEKAKANNIRVIENSDREQTINFMADSVMEQMITLLEKNV